MLTITIEHEPLPLNRLYPTSKSGKRFLSAEGASFKRLVSISTIQALAGSKLDFNPETQYISTEVFFYTPKLFTKQRKVNQKKPDLDNCFKALFDSIFEVIGFDDCYNLSVSGQVLYAQKPKIVAILRTHSLTLLEMP